VIFIPVLFPSGDFCDQCFFVGNTTIETLLRENAEFGFSHIEPTAVLWCVCAVTVREVMIK
jgi:hypothetical protein